MVAGQDNEDYIILGHIGGTYGLKGWLKIHSATRPIENILNYSSWWLQSNQGWVSTELVEGRLHGKKIVAKLQGVDDIDAAKHLFNKKVAISRQQLPKIEPKTYYWYDLIGLSVENKAGLVLGKVVDMLETPGNDVLVVKDNDKRRLIPWVIDLYVIGVQIEVGKIIVDWEDNHEV